MKRTIVIVFASMVALFLAWVFIWSERSETQIYQRRGIIAVFDQAHKAGEKATHVTTLRNGHSITNFSTKLYLEHLDEISTAQCPNKFRVAWLNYVQTLRRKELPLSGLGSKIEFAISAKSGSASGTKDALTRLDKLNAEEASMRVQRIALNYGVQ